MRIHILSSNTRPKPKAGDRRTTKKHGLQIRVMSMVKDTQGRIIGYNCTGGRQRYEWRKPDELDRWDMHHLTEQECTEVYARRLASKVARF